MKRNARKRGPKVQAPTEESSSTNLDEECNLEDEQPSWSPSAAVQESEDSDDNTCRKRRKNKLKKSPRRKKYKYDCSECERSFSQKYIRDEHEALVHSKLENGKPIIIKVFTRLLSSNNC